MTHCQQQQISARTIVVVGLIGLAAAMGIGRFALTPLLPLMQAQGTSMAQGSWLAAANYAGYLLGALSFALLPVEPSRAARLGLLWVAILTIPMALPAPLGMALGLRFGAGIASAFVLVGVSARTLSALAQRQRSHLAGGVFAGVGIGIAVAGFVGLWAGTRSWPAEAAWLSLGGLALAALGIAWRPLASSTDMGVVAGNVISEQIPSVKPIKLIACYGVFGLGYIIPATFLPALARQLIDDPWIFGWIWPAFGAAAAFSTIVISRLFAKTKPARIWAYAHVVMAIGVVLPALWASLVAIALSAICVGGTFMVITMAGMQTARAVGGARAQVHVAHDGCLCRGTTARSVGSQCTVGVTRCNSVVQHHGERLVAVDRCKSSDQHGRLQGASGKHSVTTGTGS